VSGQEQATSLDQLRSGPVVFRSGPRQLALFLAGEETYANDNRFLNSPLKQKHVRRLERQANELVSRDFAGD